jgi:hypothetical protein
MNGNTDPKTFAVGDTIYYIEPNGYAGAYQHKRIIGETGRSWIVTSAAEPIGDWASYLAHWTKKVPKRAKGYTFGTEQEAKLVAWATANKYQIGHAVEWKLQMGSDTAKILLQVAKLIGYTPLPEEGANGKDTNIHDQR